MPIRASSAGGGPCSVSHFPPPIFEAAPEDLAGEENCLFNKRIQRLPLVNKRETESRKVLLAHDLTPRARQALLVAAVEVTSSALSEA